MQNMVVWWLPVCILDSSLFAVHGVFDVVRSHVRKNLQGLSNFYKELLGLCQEQGKWHFQSRPKADFLVWKFRI